MVPARLLLLLAACARALVAPVRRAAAPACVRSRRAATVRYNLNGHIDAIAGQFEASSVEGLPQWVQDSLTGTGLNVLTFDEANASMLSFQVLIIGLAMYVNSQKDGARGAQGQTQLLADKMREERRRRSKFDADPETLDDIDVESWFDDDDDDKANAARP